MHCVFCCEVVSGERELCVALVFFSFFGHLRAKMCCLELFCVAICWRYCTKIDMHVAMGGQGWNELVGGESTHANVFYLFLRNETC
jgi:hypothetical protein